jgi:hypothetical protein
VSNDGWGDGGLRGQRSGARKSKGRGMRDTPGRAESDAEDEGD